MIAPRRRHLIPALLCLVVATPLAAQDAMFIDASGNVGIGTNTPQGKLDVTGGVITIDNNAHYRARDTSNNNAQVFGIDSANNLVLNRETLVTDNDYQLFLGGTTIQFRNRFNVERARMQGDGRFGLGTAAPATRFHVSDTSADGAIIRVQDLDGTCDLNPEVGSLSVSCPSDERLKTNVRDLEPLAVLEDLAKIRLFEYDVISNGEHRTGPVANSLLETNPDRVVRREDDILMAVSPDPFELLAAIQALRLQVIELSNEVERLRGTASP
jgi:hypothetical protein